jgi:hypothetical protein
MAETNYIDVLEKELAGYEEARRKRSEADLEIARRLQLIRATLNMLPETERLKYERRFAGAVFADLGLTDAIREVLQANRKWMTARDVRDSLKIRGFDFSQYKSNELASVHSVLKRLKEVETTNLDNVMAWKWKGIRRVPRHK